MKRIYLDSNVFISLVNREIGSNVRGLFVEAEQFLDNLKKQRHVLVLSALFFKEVRKRSLLSQSEILAYFKEHGINIEVIGLKTDLPWRMFAAKGLHYSDALHLATAIAFKCNYFVTFNVKHFEKVDSKTRVVEPAEFY